MPDLNTIQPYVFAGLAAAIAWLFKTAIQTGKDIVAIQTTLKFYFEYQAKGAAKVLDSDNPTPPEIRPLLKRYYRDEATESDKEEIKVWLHCLIEDPKSPKSERSAALDILSAMESIAMLPKRGWFSRLWH